MTFSEDKQFPFVRDKVGKFLVAFCQSKEIHLSTALKLLYLVDVISIEETGSPITFLEYYVYKRGPVAHDVQRIIKYHSRNAPIPSRFALNSYVKATDYKPNEDDSEIKIAPLIKHDRLDFTNYELEILDKVISKYGKYTGNKLMELTHEKGSLWDQIVIEKNMDFSEKTYSYELIPFDRLRKTDDKKAHFRISSDTVDFNNAY